MYEIPDDPYPSHSEYDIPLGTGSNARVLVIRGMVLGIGHCYALLMLLLLLPRQSSINQSVPKQFQNIHVLTYIQCSSARRALYIFASLEIALFIHFINTEKKNSKAAVVMRAISSFITAL